MKYLQAVRRVFCAGGSPASCRRLADSLIEIGDCFSINHIPHALLAPSWDTLHMIVSTFIKPQYGWLLGAGSYTLGADHAGELNLLIA